jgi:hypothetical protein
MGRWDQGLHDRTTGQAWKRFVWYHYVMLGSTKKAAWQLAPCMNDVHIRQLSCQLSWDRVYQCSLPILCDAQLINKIMNMQWWELDVGCLAVFWIICTFTSFWSKCLEDTISFFIFLSHCLQSVVQGGLLSWNSCLGWLGKSKYEHCVGLYFCTIFIIASHLGLQHMHLVPNFLIGYGSCFPASQVFQASTCDTGKRPLRHSIAMLTWLGIAI